MQPRDRPEGPLPAHRVVPPVSATLSIVGVNASGKLSVLGRAPISPGDHSAAADLARGAFVCEPEHGAVLVVDDPFPAN